MRRSVKSRAEEQFASTQKKDKQALKDKEKARQEVAEHVAMLRGLRLAKEAADKEAAEAAATAKVTAKTDKGNSDPDAPGSPLLTAPAARAAQRPTSNNRIRRPPDNRAEPEEPIDLRHGSLGDNERSRFRYRHRRGQQTWRKPIPNFRRLRSASEQEANLATPVAQCPEIARTGPKTCEKTNHRALCSAIRYYVTPHCTE